MPQLWVAAGPNGAGKTTLVLRRLGERIPVVNPDTIAQELPRIDGRLDERRAGMIALERRARFLAEGTDFAIETTLTGGGVMRFLEKAVAAGFKLTLVYVGLADADLSGQRVLLRVMRGGHAVPVTALDRRYPYSMAKLVPVIGLAHRAYVFDNSGSRRRLLFIREGERTRFVARDLPGWALTALSGFLD